jgi:hypothetical protein
MKLNSLGSLSPEYSALFILIPGVESPSLQHSSLDSYLELSHSSLELPTIESYRTPKHVPFPTQLGLVSRLCDVLANTPPTVKSRNTTISVISKQIAYKK